MMVVHKLVQVRHFIFDNHTHGHRRMIWIWLGIVVTVVDGAEGTSHRISWYHYPSCGGFTLTKVRRLDEMLLAVVVW